MPKLGSGNARRNKYHPLLKRGKNYNRFYKMLLLEDQTFKKGIFELSWLEHDANKKGILVLNP